MANILVPVHVGQDTQWVARYLLKLHQRERIRVHLLTIQPRYSGVVGMFFSRIEIREFRREDADRAFAALGELLRSLGIPYNTHSVIGKTVEEITKFAQEHHCPQIVIGPTNENWIKELLFGSLTRRVESLMRSTSDKPCEVL
jgi:nucleotide-binding universal stress UspA family protein